MMNDNWLVEYMFLCDGELGWIEWIKRRILEYS